MRNKKTANMVTFAMLLAIEVVLAFTPLGFLRIGFLSITMLHIPVIICAMYLGPKYGAAMGFVMGFCSFYNATFQSNKFLFHPILFHCRNQRKLLQLINRLYTTYCSWILFRSSLPKTKRKKTSTCIKRNHWCFSKHRWSTWRNLDIL